MIFKSDHKRSLVNNNETMDYILHYNYGQKNYVIWNFKHTLLSNYCIYVSEIVRKSNYNLM